MPVQRPNVCAVTCGKLTLFDLDGPSGSPSPRWLVKGSPRKGRAFSSWTRLWVWGRPSSLRPLDCLRVFWAWILPGWPSFWANPHLFAGSSCRLRAWACRQGPGGVCRRVPGRLGGRPLCRLKLRLAGLLHIPNNGKRMPGGCPFPDWISGSQAIRRVWPDGPGCTMSIEPLSPPKSDPLAPPVALHERRLIRRESGVAVGGLRHSILNPILNHLF